MIPHSGVGGRTPSPMKDSPAAFRIAQLDIARVATHRSLRAGDPGIERQVDQRGGVDDVLDRVAERGDDPHGEDEKRERHDRIHDPADDAVEPAAEITRQRPQHAADGKRQEYRGNRDSEVETSGRQHARKHVAAEVVRTKPMRRPRRL
jgi:hypothetical protein